MLEKLALVVLSVGLLASCGFQSIETQRIEVAPYQDVADNIRIAKELVLYAGPYLQSQVPHLDRVAVGVRVGYFIPASGANPSYQITYNTTTNEVRTHLLSLKREFAEFVPRLIENHVANWETFRDLAPMAHSWQQLVYSGDLERAWNEAAPVFRATTERSQLKGILDSVKEQWGSLEESTFRSGLFYEAFGEHPEHVSLVFDGEFSKKGKSVLTVSLSEDDAGEWGVIGFKVLN